MCMKWKRVGGGDPVSSSLLSAAECWVDRQGVMGLFVISLTLVAPAFGRLSNDFLSPQTGLAPCLAPLHSTGDLANFLGLLRNGNGDSPHPPIPPSIIHLVYTQFSLINKPEIWWWAWKFGIYLGEWVPVITSIYKLKHKQPFLQYNHNRLNGLHSWQPYGGISDYHCRTYITYPISN